MPVTRVGAIDHERVAARAPRMPVLAREKFSDVKLRRACALSRPYRAQPAQKRALTG
jgi:hypothetical protein